jgi:hypothetical protein
MKYLVLILSLYIFVLTSSPCVDEPAGAYANKTEQSNNQEKSNHHCSPFCTCQCCASPVVFQEFKVSFSYVEFAEKPLSFYSSSYISTLFISIWQPPKIS